MIRHSPTNIRDVRRVALEKQKLAILRDAWIPEQLHQSEVIGSGNQFVIDMINRIDIGGVRTWRPDVKMNKNNNNNNHDNNI